jgi:hypothetical protein
MNYQRHYDALIERARCREVFGYVERHHVVPKCMGGSDDKSNLVPLTPEEHFVAHQLLIRIYPEVKGLAIAVWRMTFGKHHENSKRYGWLRRKHSEAIGEVIGKYWRGRKREKFSEQHKQRISAGQLGKIRGAHSADHKAKLSEAHRGKTLTQEHREKLSKAKLGIKRAPYAEKICPHCGYTGRGGAMSRWHFDNCKEKLNGQN